MNTTQPLWNTTQQLWNTTQPQWMSNNTDESGILYSYTLKSDNSRYVIWSLETDFSLLSFESYWIAYAAIIFGGLVLIHSYIINMGRKMNAVRLLSDLAALFCVVYAGLFLLSANQQNKTKTAIALDLCGYGLIGIGIQLCDAYMFVNRYRAITKISKLKQWVTHIYIIFIMITPYYSIYTFLPLFVDMNLQPDPVNAIYVLNSWVTIGYNLYFTYEFSRIGYHFIQKSKQLNSNSSTSKGLKRIVILSLCHCLTSSVANALIYFSDTFQTFYFDSSMYNLMLVFGIHFFFNFKIESSYCVKLVQNNRRRIESRYSSENSPGTYKSKKLRHVQISCTPSVQNSSTPLYEGI
jgi:hypothetical protein